MSVKTRRYIYSIAISVMPLLIALGYLQTGVAELVLNIASAVLGVGASALALKNAK